MILTQDQRDVVKLVFANAILDHLNSPMFRRLQANFVLSLKKQGFSSTEALKAAVEIQCAALRFVADTTEERATDLLRIAEEFEKR